VKRTGIILAVVALLACVPLVTTSNVVLNFLVVALLIALVGQGWNVLGGYGGQYSFGHAAFFGTAAYTTGILQLHYGVNAVGGTRRSASRRAHWSASITGALSFRSGLRGSYFALVTLAFAEVLRIIASVAPITGAGRRHADQARPAPEEPSSSRAARRSTGSSSASSRSRC
jgi:branched-chain amino acid transport system permease protein